MNQKFTNFEQFWQFLSRELKIPKKFGTVTGRGYKAVFEVNRIRFIFDDQMSRIEYKDSFEKCYNLYLDHAPRHEYKEVSFNASYVLPILIFYLR